MLAELAAANAAFGIIKQFVSNGKELSGCAKHISDFVFSKEELEKKAKKKKAKGVGSADFFFLLLPDAVTDHLTALG